MPRTWRLIHIKRSPFRDSKGKDNLLTAGTLAHPTVLCAFSAFCSRLRSLISATFRLKRLPQIYGRRSWPAFAAGHHQRTHAARKSTIGGASTPWPTKPHPPVGRRPRRSHDLPRK